jgi:hypothetical protein
MARLLERSALVNVIEANDSQTGKGFLSTLGRAIYDEAGYTLAKREDGVGSFDESLGRAIASGSPFVVMDNLRARMASEYFEMIITVPNGIAPMRLPYRAEFDADINRVSFHATSNGFETTVDMGNRSMVTRLLKKPPGFKFKAFDEGDVLKHLQAKQAFYLGCVFSVVRVWFAQGKPRLPTNHSFIEWVGTLDWIVQKIFNLPPLMEGHSGAVERMTNPSLTWLRAMMLLVLKHKRGGEELSAAALSTIAEEEGIGIPGVIQGADDQKRLLQIGIVMKRCFGDGDSVLIDAYEVRRVKRKEYSPRRHEWTEVKRYIVAGGSRCRLRNKGRSARRRPRKRL